MDQDPQVFTQALAQPGQSAGYVDPYAAQLAAMRAQLAKPQAPAYTPEQVAQRRAQNQHDYEMGLLGTLSGDDQLGAAGGQIFKQALAARQPTITEKGTSDPLSGEWTYNPAYLRERDETQLDKLQERSDTARGAHNEALLRAQERAEQNRIHAQDQMALHQMIAASRNSGDGPGGKGNFEQAGLTPDGKQVVTNSHTGISYTLDIAPNGAPTYTPFGGAITPKGTVEKNIGSIQDALASAGRADDLLKMVNDHPEAFGMRAGATSFVPGAAQGYASKALGLSPDTMAMRANLLRQGAMEINQLYGAALSTGEAARAATFLPNPTDPPEVLIAKLTAARDWAKSKAGQYGQTMVRTAEQRAAPTTAAPAAGGAGWGITRKP